MHLKSMYMQVRDLLEDDGIFLLQIAGLRRAFQVSCLLETALIVWHLLTEHQQDSMRTWSGGCSWPSTSFLARTRPCPSTGWWGSWSLRGLRWPRYVHLCNNAVLCIQLNEKNKQVDNIGIHYSLTLKKWYDNWVVNKAVIVEKHGERWFRIFHFFLAWSTFIAGSGAATCYQLTCHKNLNVFDRRMLGVPAC